MQRIDDEHMRRGGIGVGLRIVGALRRRIDLRERLASHSGRPVISAPARSASNSRDAADRHLHQHRGDGRQHVTSSTPTMPSGLRRPPRKKAKFASIETAPAIIATMVMVSVSRLLHMAQLMREHAREFLLVDAKQSAGHAHRRMLGIASGREGVRLRFSTI